MEKTAKEKAKELINRYINLFYHPTEQYLDIDEAKQCALIAVDEILDCTKNGLGLTKYSKEYWQEVKQELIKSE